MNVIRNAFNVTVRDEFDMCSHLEVGQKAYRVIYEYDSFGTLGAWACCEACSEAADKAEDEENVICFDCGGEFQRQETHEWKPYDFYAAQGDEPLIICKTCRIAPKHLARVRNDEDNYNWEFGLDDQEDVDECYDAGHDGANTFRKLDK